MQTLDFMKILVYILELIIRGMTKDRAILKAANHFGVPSNLVKRHLNG